MLIKFLFVIYFDVRNIFLKVIKLSIFEFLFLLFVAFGVLFRLYQTFGTNAKDSGVKIILKPVNKNQEKQILQNISQLIENKSEQIEALSSATINENVSEKEQGSFNQEMFLNGARKVFELILSAFNQGDLTPVRELMSKKVFEAFNAVIENRRSENITSEVDFICFDKSEIKDIKHLKNTVKIVVEFVSEQVSLLKNKEGEVIEGDENFVQKITDMWTFERPLNAKNNIWTLVSTKKSA